MLAQKMQQHGATGWLVNTGWSGGRYGNLIVITSYIIYVMLNHILFSPPGMDRESALSYLTPGKSLMPYTLAASWMQITRRLKCSDLRFPLRLRGCLQRYWIQWTLYATSWLTFPLSTILLSVIANFWYHFGFNLDCSGQIRKHTRKHCLSWLAYSKTTSRHSQTTRLARTTSWLKTSSRQVRTSSEVLGVEVANKIEEQSIYFSFSVWVKWSFVCSIGAIVSLFST